MFSGAVYISVIHYVHHSLLSVATKLHINGCKVDKIGTGPADVEVWGCHCTEMVGNSIAWR